MNPAMGAALLITLMVTPLLIADASREQRSLATHPWVALVIGGFVLWALMAWLFSQLVRLA